MVSGVTRMSIKIRGVTYFQTREVLRQANISRSTFLRWLAQGIVADAAHRDRRGWRIFDEFEMGRLVAEAKKYTQNRNRVNMYG